MRILHGSKSRALALACVAIAACGGGGGGDQGGTVDTYYVDSAIGLDGNAGTMDRPFKTIQKALSVASAGQTVILFAGTYDAASGETWGYTLPAGVTLKANTSGVLLRGSGTGTAFTLEDGSRIDYVELERFGVALRASGASQTLTGAILTGNGTGLSADGTAAVTLTSAMLTGNSVGLSAIDTAQLTLGSVTIEGGRGGIELYESARLTMTGGTISGMGPNCAGGVHGLYVGGAAEATLQNVTIRDVFGSAIELRQASSATVRNGSLFQDGSGGCGNGETIGVVESASLHLIDTNVTNGHDPYALVLAYSPSVWIDLDGGQISGGNTAGVYAQGTLTVDWTSIGTSFYGIWVAEGQANVSNADIVGNGVGIYVSQGPLLTLRMTEVRNSTTTGIQVFGAVDLGTGASPGGNVITSNPTGVRASGAALYTVSAVGNTWNPSAQGADVSGHYASALVTGPAGGSNYTLDSATQRIQF